MWMLVNDKSEVKRKVLMLKPTAELDHMNYKSNLCRAREAA